MRGEAEGDGEGDAEVGSDFTANSLGYLPFDSSSDILAAALSSSLMKECDCVNNEGVDGELALFRFSCNLLICATLGISIGTEVVVSARLRCGRLLGPTASSLAVICDSLGVLEVLDANSLSTNTKAGGSASCGSSWA